MCGAGLCGSVRTGILLYLIHIAAALLTGLAIAGRGAAPPKAGPRPQPRVLPLSQCLTQATEQAGRSCLKITAFIMLFSMLRRVLEAAGFFSFAQVACAPLLWFLGAPAEAAEPLATGLLEMTSGLVLLPESAGRGLLPAMSLLVGFGGLSVLCQTAAAVNGLSLRRLFYGKVPAWPDRRCADHARPVRPACPRPGLCPAACHPARPSGGWRAVLRNFDRVHNFLWKTAA